jgi:hypothetical protein
MPALQLEKKGVHSGRRRLTSLESNGIHCKRESTKFPFSSTFHPRLQRVFLIMDALRPASFIPPSSAKSSSTHPSGNTPPFSLLATARSSLYRRQSSPSPFPLSPSTLSPIQVPLWLPPRVIHSTANAKKTTKSQG